MIQAKKVYYRRLPHFTGVYQFTGDYRRLYYIECFNFQTSYRRLPHFTGVHPFTGDYMRLYYIGGFTFQTSYRR